MPCQWFGSVSYTHLDENRNENGERDANPRRHGMDEQHSVKVGLFDEPDERKIHQCVVPRLGGMAFKPVAVSYTHLDVYKRQVVCRAVRHHPSYTCLSVTYIIYKGNNCNFNVKVRALWHPSN